MRLELNGFGFLLAKGLGVTISVSLSAFFWNDYCYVFTLLGLGPSKSLRLLVELTTTFIRGLPELWVLFAVYFRGGVLLSHLFQHSMQMNAFVSGVFALGIIFAAYATQTLRGAFLAVPKGQIESGTALGFSRGMIFRRILLPQACHHALPGVGNLWLVLLKDSSLVALIGLGDSMNKSGLAASTTRQPLKVYLVAAFLFLVLTSISQWFFKRGGRMGENT